ncbi:hypothetical protein CC80DRAFT_115345 [Byssothecium circinans]|uniref:Uncharacterized protein n=1 Tax=Byssothecium circinans TaxID=147558 RepID=A0A6A5U0N9_9PLEO|nr:hypothetical protein CC80DRAFT_115345 [Byssothecium circinans]
MDGPASRLDVWSQTTSRAIRIGQNSRDTQVRLEREPGEICEMWCTVCCETCCRYRYTVQVATVRARPSSNVQRLLQARGADGPSSQGIRRILSRNEGSGAGEVDAKNYSRIIGRTAGDPATTARHRNLQEDFRNTAAESRARGDAVSWEASLLVGFRAVQVAARTGRLADRHRHRRGRRRRGSANTGRAKCATTIGQGG